jgi:hypothetical protein
LPNAAGFCQRFAMTYLSKNSMARSATFAGICLLGLAGSALAQTAEPDNAKALLEKVKRRDIDRQITARQTEIDRLAEDLAKGHKEAETMQANIDATGSLLKESAAHLSQLVSQRKRLEQVIELTTLRIEAERLKAEGLHLLGDAQGKALIALTKRAEETDVRASLGGAELKLLTPAEGAPGAEAAARDGAKMRPALADLRRKLAIAENAAANAEKIARDAMRAASSKLELADIAGIRAKRKGSTVESDLPEIAEKPVDLEEKKDEPAKKAIPAR